MKLVDNALNAIAFFFIRRMIRKKGELDPNVGIRVAAPDMGSEDWAMVWSPEGADEGNGFSMVTPMDFNPRDLASGVKIPMGASLMVSLFFLIGSGGEEFAREMIERAGGKQAPEPTTAERKTFN